MSAAATAAGYLYASGRLRGRGKDGEEAEKNDKGGKPEAKRRPIRVAALPDAEQQQAAAPKAKAPVKVQYRVRRWRPDAE